MLNKENGHSAKRKNLTWLHLGPAKANKQVCLVISLISTLSAKKIYLRR